MTNEDLRFCTTFELEHVINHFTWYENSFLARVKRELDRRHRIKLIKRQQQQQKENYERNIRNNK